MGTFRRSVVLSLGLACAALGCAGGDDGGATTLEIAPADAVLEVVNGVAATQDYTATLVHPDRSREDVTGQVTFTLDEPALGTFAGATLTAPGTAAGPTTVRAALADVEASARLAVRVRGVRFVQPVPANAPGLFAAAREDPAIAPTLAYPDDHVLLPPNLGELDVHWRDTADNDLFEVTLANDHVDLRLYLQVTSLSDWTTYAPAEWALAASARAPLSVTVAGLRTIAPATKGTAAPRTLDVTNEGQRGAIYYSIDYCTGILRHDVADPTAPTTALVSVPRTRCVGCHALPPDGARAAISFDDWDRTATVGLLDLATGAELIPPEREWHWNFTSFRPDGGELVASRDGQLELYAADGTASLGRVPGDLVATHPAWSPDGTRLAYVEHIGSDLVYPRNGTIAVRSYDQATGTFGPVQRLVPYDAIARLASFYPSWSPDGAWLAITRNDGEAVANETSQVWVVKADGSAPPIALALANQGDGLGNSVARWAPFAQTAGPDHEPLYYLTFSSKRPFGSRRSSSGSSQIWMTPFFPARANAGLDPSGPAFRPPHQALDTSNYNAQWTERLVGE